jgi:hypothetical protein
MQRLTSDRIGGNAATYRLWLDGRDQSLKSIALQGHGAPRFEFCLYYLRHIRHHCQAEPCDDLRYLGPCLTTENGAWLRSLSVRCRMLLHHTPAIPSDTRITTAAHIPLTVRCVPITLGLDATEFFECRGGRCSAVILP